MSHQSIGSLKSLEKAYTTEYCLAYRFSISTMHTTTDCNRHIPRTDHKEQEDEEEEKNLDNLWPLVPFQAYQH